MTVFLLFRWYSGESGQHLVGVYLTEELALEAQNWDEKSCMGCPHYSIRREEIQGM